MNNSCPVCDQVCESSVLKHEFWGTEILSCNYCSHQFSSDFIDTTDDIFATNRIRAEHYTRIIEEIQPTSMIDVGTPSDFLLLKLVNSVLESCELYALDVYEKPSPDFIQMLSPENIKPTEICTALHVLEHVQDPETFVRLLINNSKYWIIEVPNITDINSLRTSSQKPHFHFFNISSFTKLISEASASAEIVVRFGRDMPKNRSCLIAHNLPKDIDVLHQRSRLSSLIRRLTSKIDR